MALTIDTSTLRLPDHEYFPAPQEKTGIAIHHTVGGSAASTYSWWKGDNQMVGTAYLIDRDGTVYEVFDPKAWAWQFGLKWDREKKIGFERRFIGIEICSEGGLLEQNGKFYCFDRISEKTEKPKSEVFDYGKDFRGYRYFDRYEDAQVDALVALVNKLCDDFSIERRVPDGLLAFYGEKLADFRGIIGHTMVRTDKSDPLPDAAFWGRLVSECNLQRVPDTTDTPAPAAAGGTMTPEENEALWQHNVGEFGKMAVGAGAMIKGLLREIERKDRNTYVRLKNATPGGHRVEYEFVEGDRSLVATYAKALGFKTVTDSVLEVVGG